MDTEAVQVPQLTASPIREKWGAALDWGFVVVPAVLIKKQRELGLECEDIVLLVHLLVRWWKKDEMPFPRTDTLAQRTGLARRTVQRRLVKLERLGLLVRVKTRKSARTPRQITQYDMGPLARRLQEEVKTAATPLRTKEQEAELEWLEKELAAAPRRSSVG